MANVMFLFPDTTFTKFFLKKVKKKNTNFLALLANFSALKFQQRILFGFSNSNVSWDENVSSLLNLYFHHYYDNNQRQHFSRVIFLSTAESSFSNAICQRIFKKMAATPFCFWVYLLFPSFWFLCLLFYIAISTTLTF